MNFLRTLMIFALFVLSMSAYGYTDNGKEKLLVCYLSQQEECDLAGTDLSYMTLGNIYIGDLDLSGTDLSSADLRDVVALNETNLEGAIYDQYTAFPKSFIETKEPYEYGMVFSTNTSPIGQDNDYRQAEHYTIEFSRRF